MTIDPLETPETLDPQDWEAMRALAHRMVDDMLDHLRDVREGPVWQPTPTPVKEYLKQPMPVEPQAPEAIYQDFTEQIKPYAMGNIHPRFWGWVMGNGTPLAMLADMLAAGVNPNMGGGDHVANYVEAEVIDWCKQMYGFPPEASGLLVSGGSMANLVALAVARNTQAGFDLRKQGLQACRAPLTVYCSVETHSSVQKAIELMGMGSDALRRVPVDGDYRIDVGALKAMLASDRAAGMQPICIVGNAGTVNTGAFDDLQALLAICRQQDLWFHVDGAFGSLAALSPELKHLTAGMEQADSIAFDLHKWFHIPFEAGCVLVRSEEAHRRAFSLTPNYLSHATRGLAGGSLWFSDYGVQLSRGFRALKVWMSFKEHGIDKFGRLAAQNVRQARYLAALVDAQPELQRLAPVPLNIVCLRYCPPGYDEDELNRFNQELLIRLHESGSAAPSYTTLNGHYALRVCIVNHRSRKEDFDLLVSEVLRLGREMQAEGFGR